MLNKKATFALFLGNRGFFPGALISDARAELIDTLKGWGHEVLVMDEDATRYGAVETVREGARFAAFLEENRGRFDGIILSLPNFGDENGAVAALKNAGVPIFVHAYPDQMDKMGPDLRRDAFCGKISIMDVFYQNDIQFTALKPHVVSPASPRFRANIDYFDRVCRVVAGMRDLRVGAIGARTTAFKTVRVDEFALQRHDITVETLDLSDVFARVRAVDPQKDPYQEKASTLRAYSSWAEVPDHAFDQIVRLGVVMDDLIEEYRLDAFAFRCWLEIQQELGISPCVILSEMNDRGIAGACEVDVANAVVMHALKAASDGPATCLDWNNNYGEDDDRCILFHCGPAPRTLMAEGARVTDHLILATSLGEGHSYGCNVGRFAPTDFTFGSMMTVNGELRFYLGEGDFTTDSIPREFFGVAGVARIPQLQDVLLHIGLNGFRHHVSLTPGHIAAPVREALERYLGLDVSMPQGT